MSEINLIYSELNVIYGMVFIVDYTQLHLMDIYNRSITFDDRTTANNLQGTGSKS